MEHVGYFRVSTLQQGASGLGLAAQKDLVMRFIGNGVLLAEFTEVESGKRHRNRPQLLAALELCKKKKAKLVIAKLDRLSRNVAFISSLMESGVDFVCCDNPHANRLMLHMLAAFAEHERQQISERVTAALARIKEELRHGPRVSQAGRLYEKLGGPKLTEAREKAAAMRRRPGQTTLDLIVSLRRTERSYESIAAELNARDIRTPRLYQLFSQGRGGSRRSALAPPPSIADLDRWMARYQQADPEAPVALIGALSPALLRFFRTQDLMSREQADDLLQETWLRIHRVRHTYRPGQPVLPWVYAIARRVRVDGYRRTRRVRAHEIATEILPEPRPRFETRNSLPAFETLVAVLPEAQREVVTMLKAGGLSLEEVARATSCTVGAVKQKASRAYERLRRLLQEEKNELP